MFARIIVTLLLIPIGAWLGAVSCWLPQVPGAESAGGNQAWRPATPADHASEVPAVRPEGLPAAGSDSLPGAAGSGTGVAAPAGTASQSGGQAGPTRGEGRVDRSGQGAAHPLPGGGLPGQHGQVWRQYDISPYTTRATTSQRPEQAIVEWILRETGYETWHGEVVAVLSADRQVLRVYHTPAVQAMVADVVDRFLASLAEPLAFSLRVVSIDHPNWRARAHRALRPIPVQTAGANAWLLEKEDAALLLADLQRRSDYREHGSPHLLVNSGQSTAVTLGRHTPYTRDVVWRQDLAGGFETVVSRADEGFLVELTPLPTVDRKLIDATVRCEVTQVERLVPVVLDVPTPAAPRQRMKIEVPQMVQFRFHERFRWPADKVLLVSFGVTPSPDGKGTGGIALPFGVTPGRSDLLVFVECKGQPRETARNPAAATREARTYQGRY